jgi:hypothetical protein
MKDAVRIVLNNIIGDSLIEAARPHQKETRLFQEPCADQIASAPAIPSGAGLAIPPTLLADICFSC